MTSHTTPPFSSGIIRRQVIPTRLRSWASISATGGSVRWIDTTSYHDFLIVSVGWTPDSRDVVYQVQNRTQTWLDLNRADARTGSPRRILRETGKRVGRTVAGPER